MPARSSSKASASAAAASKPLTFDFKKVKRSKPSSGGGTSRESQPTKAWLQRSVHQSGKRKGEEANNMLFVFNLRWDLNDQAKDAVQPLAYGKDKVSGFNLEFRGFHVKVHVPAQARRMDSALSGLDPTMAELDTGDWADPELTVVALKNLNLPGTKTSAACEGVTALMLNGYSYPLYKKLRDLKYDFVRGVHGKTDVNYWVRVVQSGECASVLEKDTVAALKAEGWHVEVAAADAAEWGSEDEDEDTA